MSALEINSLISQPKHRSWILSSSDRELFLANINSENPNQTDLEQYNLCLHCLTFHHLIRNHEMDFFQIFKVKKLPYLT